MLTFLYSLPNVRGSSFLLRLVDRICGPRPRRTVDGAWLKTYLSSAQDATFFRRTSSPHVLVNEIENLPKDGVFIDCGANCGYYSIIASRVLGKDGSIFAFEPSNREYDRLAWAAMNNPHECKWITNNSCVSNENNICSVNTSVGHTGMNRVDEFVHSAIQCISIKLDDYIPTYLPEGKLVDLVKIDVEGFEMRVLQGMKLLLEQRRIGCLVVEITDRFLKENESSKAELYDFMIRVGYVPSINSEEWQYDEVFRWKE